MSQIYKVVSDTPGGWMDFVARYKEAHPDELLTAASYKVIMQLYLRRNEK